MKEPRIKNSRLINVLITIAGKKGLREMTKASKNGKKAQSEVLRRTLSTAKDTVYGKEHHFEEILAAQSPEELFRLYQKNVKINDYEDFRPYVERHKNGESDILLPGKPKMYATTSGTTKEPKWIPVTEAEEFTAQVDRCLQEYNPEYREKRASNRVKAPETVLLGTESFERFKATCISRGYRDGQFKLNLLMQDEKRQAMFKELVK
jgi:hypothetical protein